MITLDLPYKLQHQPTQHAVPCPTCWTMLIPRHLRILTIHCGHCRGAMKFALVKGASFYGPHQFLDQEITAAKRAGVIFHTHYSSKIKCGYLSIICPHCSAPFGGAHPRQYAHLEELWLAPLNIPSRPLYMLETGNDCEACNHHYGYPENRSLTSTTS